MCPLDPCQSWLVRSAWQALAEWAGRLQNTLFWEGMVLFCLKVAAIRPALEKPSLDPDILPPILGQGAQWGNGDSATGNPE